MRVQPGFARVESVSGLVALSLVWILAADLSLVRGGNGTPTIEDIEMSWRKRQEAANSFDISWSGTEFISSAGIEKLRPAGGPKQANTPRLADVSFSITGRLVLDGSQRVRFEYEGRTLRGNDLVEQKVVEAFDGKSRKVFYPSGGLSFPAGHVLKGAAGSTANDVRSLPAVIAFRPLSRELGGFAPGSLRITGQVGIADGQKCIVLRNGQYTVWVDPEREFIPVRLYEWRDGATAMSIDIKYSRNEAHGWIPSSWKMAMLSRRGEPERSFTTSVTDCRVNEPFPPGTFENIFPPATVVEDATSDKEYLVLQDGSHRTIRPGEFSGTNYQELLSNSPSSSYTAWAGRLVVLACLTAIAMVLVLRLYRRHVGGALKPPADS